MNNINNMDNNIISFLKDLSDKGIRLSYDIVKQQIEIGGDVSTLSETDYSMVKKNKDIIADYLTSTSSSLGEILPIEKSDKYHLSYSQERIWLVSRNKQANIAYNIPGILNVIGEINIELLEKSINKIIARHEILRTSFKSNYLGVFQCVRKYDEEQYVEYIDMRNVDDNCDVVRENIIKLMHSPFRLDEDRLIKFYLYHIAEEKYILFINMHHIISDGWSINVVLDELISFYNFPQKQKIPLRFQYKDYAAWYNKLFESGKLNKAHEYWIEQFSGEIPVLNLFGDNKRPTLKTYNGSIVQCDFVKEDMINFSKLIKEQGCTSFMGIMALLNIILARYSSQNDIIVGIPVVNRNNILLEDQIGYYSNMIALRNTLEDNDTFVSLLKKIKKNILNAYEYQDYPFDKLIKELGIERDMSRSPLFDIMILLVNSAKDEFYLGGAVLKRCMYHNSTSKYDLTFTFMEDCENITSIAIEYNTDIYTESQIDRLATHFGNLVSSVLSDPNEKYSKYDYLSYDEKYKLIEEFNSTYLEYSSKHDFLYLFNKCVKDNPNDIAVICNDEVSTFQQLDELSTQLCNFLKYDYNVEDAEYIALNLVRSKWIPISIIAIFKANCIYVPIDPNYPTDRIEYIKNDTDCKIVIDEQFIQKFEEALVSGIDYTQKDGNNQSLSLQKTDVAYVIYTSGSTGEPKGVLITHNNLTSFLHWANKEFNNWDYNICYAVTSISFDLSIFEILYNLSVGKKIRILSSGLDIGNWIEKDEKILINTVPSLIWELIKGNISFKNVVGVNMAGEVIPQKIIKQLFSKYRLQIRNLYGPSETTTYSTIYHFSSPFSPVLIGKPISNTQIYILDKNKELLPIGSTGEIYIGGEGVSGGYLKQPFFIGEKFVLTPYDNKRIYATGDIARWLEDGNIELVGRKDNQVKIRGFRIELGEIESKIQFFENIDKAIVLVKIEKDEKILSAYISSSKDVDINKLRTYLATKLPAYMIPSHYYIIEKMPLLRNGKVDIKKLLEIDIKVSSNKKEYIMPQNEIEERVHMIWSNILDIETKSLSVNDNFFDIGGHSMKAFQIVTRIQNEFGIQLSIEELFMTLTIAKLAEVIGKKVQENDKNNILII